MRLFAIIAIVVRPESNPEDHQEIVISFLKNHLNQDLIPEYLKVFIDYFLEKKPKSSKAIPVFIATKILIISNEINKELAQSQKIIVLIQLLEFVKSNILNTTADIEDVLDTIANSFNISDEEYHQIKEYVISDVNTIPDSEVILLIDNQKSQKYADLKTKHMEIHNLKGQVRVLNVVSINMYFIRYLNTNKKEIELNLNGQHISEGHIYSFTTGSSLRNPQINPIYYSDVVNRFAEDRISSKIIFDVRNIEYKFSNGNIGLHDVSFTEYSGSLVGIMGASGAGKSTLLNVLNGSSRPTSGNVSINGVCIHTEADEIEGIIGHVSQDDLLIEELSVFQNLYYNAKLCFDNYSEEKLNEAVNRVLKDLGLYEIREIPVGSPLNKKISGGQRKRLNIALELIREPAVLFLDEPTSGLSSRDSENILDLLKELSLKGKLVFVVIHQPSSDIFKMFDKLLILDTGGYLIYNGNPVDSIMYFKEIGGWVNWKESECHSCGNVNPEQIFNIVEASIIDEHGKPTGIRKKVPTEWREKFIENDKPKKADEKITAGKDDLPEILFKIPGKIKQFWIFAKRDILKKLSDTQYLAINFLEAPILAFLLAYIIKYFNVDVGNKFGYTLLGNSNLPVYIFMSVIVGIFMGLTVSAEEIIKDKKILKREAFLNLSWSSYLVSKVFVQFILSAIQAATFVLIGNTIMEIKGMYFIYWLVLFSAWTFSNMLGLLISDSFKTVVTIYILIPFLVIPQIILSGIIVKYEKLNPKISNPKSIPWYGEIITARWAYEALATYQFKENDYQKRYYNKEKLLRNASFKENFLLNELINKTRFNIKNLGDEEFKEQIDYNTELLKNEIIKEHQYRKQLAVEEKGIPVNGLEVVDLLNPETINNTILNQTLDYLLSIQKLYNRIYKHVYESLKEQRRNEDPAFIEQLERSEHNETLEEFVTNKNEFQRIVEYKGELIQKKDPIYLDPQGTFIKAHFYAPRKQVFGTYFPTLWVTVLVIWLSTLLIYIALYFRLLKRLLDSFENLKFKKSK